MCHRRSSQCSIRICLHDNRQVVFVYRSNCITVGTGPGAHSSDKVMALVVGRRLGISGVEWKELCYRRPETLGDREDGVRWWQYNVL